MQRRQFLLSAASAAALLAVPAVQAAGTTLKIGVTAGPSAEILEHVLPIAKELGLTIKIYEFQDYIQPNAALDAGDIDANIYCTKPFLDNENKTRGYHLAIAAPAFTLPMAVYSKKIKNLKDLPEGATVGIPNDPAMAHAASSFLSRAASLSSEKARVSSLRVWTSLKIRKSSRS